MIPTGEKIVCENGHELGHFYRDVADGEPITGEDLTITGKRMAGMARGHECSECGAPVARMINDYNWEVRTAGGWICSG